MRQGWGDIWTWVALDADTKLVPSWFIGNRDAGCAYHFMHDLADRLANRVQLTTDGHKAYLTAVEDAFGCKIDYAQLIKLYGEANDTAHRYSPPKCTGVSSKVITGKPRCSIRVRSSVTSSIRCRSLGPTHARTKPETPQG